MAVVFTAAFASSALRLFEANLEQKREVVNQSTYAWDLPPFFHTINRHTFNSHTESQSTLVCVVANDVRSRS
jgi:hypothetical protein